MLPIDFTPLDEYTRLMAVNYMGVVEIIKTFLPLITSSRGRIVTTCSVGGLVTAGPGLASYTASKFAVNGFMATLRYTCYGEVQN